MAGGGVADTPPRPTYSGLMSRYGQALLYITYICTLARGMSGDKKQQIRDGAGRSLLDGCMVGAREEPAGWLHG
jgi:hypothetical protein